MSAERWINQWQTKFASMGVQLVVADVGQSSIFLDMAERQIVLAPSLNLVKADRLLSAVYKWWKRDPEAARVACAFA